MDMQKVAVIVSLYAAIFAIAGIEAYFKIKKDKNKHENNK